MTAQEVLELYLADAPYNDDHWPTNPLIEEFLTKYLKDFALFYDVHMSEMDD